MVLAAYPVLHWSLIDVCEVFTVLSLTCNQCRQLHGPGTE